MTTTFITGTATAALTMDGSDYLIVKGSFNGDGLTNALNASGAFNSVLIEGSFVNVNGRALYFSGGNNTVTVGQSGSVNQLQPFGGSAVFFDTAGFNRVLN